MQEEVRDENPGESNKFDCVYRVFADRAVHGSKRLYRSATGSASRRRNCRPHFSVSSRVSVASLLTLLATMDWRRPWRALRSLGLPGVALVTAFIVLYHLEHYH